MPSLRSAWKCMFAPRLIQIYGNAAERLYEPQILEQWGNQVISSLCMLWKLGLYTSPMWGIVLYNNGYFESLGLTTITKLVAGVGVILIVSFCIRGFSRAHNSTYLRFLEVLHKAQVNIVENKQDLMKYDFEFSAWPVEYDLRVESSSSKVKIARKITNQSTMEYLISLPFRIIAYFAIHTFGIRLIYPGSIKLLQMVLESSLQQGRTRLIDFYGGQRYKLKSADGNTIDMMVLDRRNTHPHGDTLVICCEGNAGFYEIGTMITPTEAGYSVLGWNHPGFGGSTGMPYPAQEEAAMDAVMQFAINKLGFKLENIVLFGWSIGGYSVSWATVAYPEIKGAVIDATFDDILPLALNQMPKWWEPIVKLAIREYVDLDISELLSKFPGPLLLIRRTKDEVICTNTGDLSSNRGNNLLLKILRNRYPCIFDEHQLLIINEYLAVTGSKQGTFEHLHLIQIYNYLITERILEQHNVDDTVCISLLQSYISEYSKSYPMKIGEDLPATEKNQLALFLAKKYMKDFKATHCVSLPGDMFALPWDVNVESDFVFT
ncbi:phosphatidylserine lipase ABHD16A isoform X1 [Euwallacea similis]|uniref:phosphatidylserine lipase ABHD16A isoform X1 n=1 Tax=Euwallacea similis TaxID=1736056 RepID=UPI0034510183